MYYYRNIAHKYPLSTHLSDQYVWQTETRLHSGLLTNFQSLKTLPYQAKNTENHLMSFSSSLHIHTKTNPHKVSDITQRYLHRNASYQWCTVREHPALSPYLGALQCGWVSGGGRCGGRCGGRWVELQAALCCVVLGHWSLSWLDNVKWGQQQGRPAGSQRNAGFLSVVKELWNLRKKSKRLCRKTQTGTTGCFSCPAPLWLADLMLRLRCRMTPTVTAAVI